VTTRPFYCVCRSDSGDVLTARTVTAPNAIEAIRVAAADAGIGQAWTAYQPVVTKNVRIEREEIRPRVLFSDPEERP
jgi:hypothetical protein